MRFPLRSITSMIGLLCLFGSFAVAQVNDDLTLTEDLGTIELPASETAVVGTDDVDLKSLRVRLNETGTLKGRLHVQFATGKSQPATAKIAFAKDGDLIETSQTDEAGQFEIQNIQPGDYIATAVIDAGSTNFNVQVMQYDPAAGDQDMVLEGTLTPIPDEGCTDCVGEVVLDEGIVDACTCGAVDGNCTCGVEEIIEEPCEEFLVEEEYYQEQVAGGCCGCGSGGFSGGGCCGGGAVGGGLGWLGAAGLAAGITALALDDDNPVSPAAP